MRGTRPVILLGPGLSVHLWLTRGGPGGSCGLPDLPARGSAGRQESLCLGVLTCQSERGGGTDFRNEKKLSYSAERDLQDELRHRSMVHI